MLFLTNTDWRTVRRYFRKTKIGVRFSQHAFSFLTFKNILKKNNFYSKLISLIAICPRFGLRTLQTLSNPLYFSQTSLPKQIARYKINITPKCHISILIILCNVSNVESKNIYHSPTLVLLTNVCLLPSHALNTQLNSIKFCIHVVRDADKDKRVLLSRKRVLLPRDRKITFSSTRLKS